MLHNLRSDQLKLTRKTGSTLRSSREWFEPAIRSSLQPMQQCRGGGWKKVNSAASSKPAVVATTRVFTFQVTESSGTHTFCISWPCMRMPANYCSPKPRRDQDIIRTAYLNLSHTKIESPLFSCLSTLTLSFMHQRQPSVSHYNMVFPTTCLQTPPRQLSSPMNKSLGIPDDTKVTKSSLPTTPPQPFFTQH
jgi:hypothetical protein